MPEAQSDTVGQLWPGDDDADSQVVDPALELAMQITLSLADVPEACSTPESSAGDKQTDETPLYMEIHSRGLHK